MAREYLRYDLKMKKDLAQYGITIVPVLDKTLMWHLTIQGPEKSPYGGSSFNVLFMAPKTYPCVDTNRRLSYIDKHVVPQF